MIESDQMPKETIDILVDTAQNFAGALDDVSPELAEEVGESQEAVADCMRRAANMMMSESMRYL